MTEAKRRKPLTHDRQADTAKPEEKPYHLNAGEGLFLEVQPTGSKLWRYRATVNGKRVLLSMGKYPAVGLAEAKARRDEANRQIEQGIDPREAKKAAKAESEGRNLFCAIAAQWMHSRDHISDSARARETTLLSRDINPALGQMPIDQIKARDVLDMARKIEDREAAA